MGESNGRLGPYELLGELGRGAMARVWRARDPRLGREVAIKEPFFDEKLPQEVRDEMARRFVQEARTAAALNHPNIVTIYSADVYDGRPAIVMELVEGATLGEILNAGPLDAASALDALDQLLDAVGYAHEKGVVHRDIKPDNVFVSTEGRVKLSDFGIARASDTATRATVAGSVLGTPGYMSPEQASGRQVDARSDLFSVGVVAYEMLSGSNPFGTASDTDAVTLLYRIVHEPAPELPDNVCAGLPADMRPAIRAALSKDPANRPQTAADFKAMLHGGGVASVSSAATKPLAASVRTASGRRKWVPYVAVVAVLAIIAIGLFAVANMGGKPTNSGGLGDSASTYYLTLSNGHVALYDAGANKLVEETDIDVADLDSADATQLGARIAFDSRADAEAQIKAYRDQVESAGKPKGAVPPVFNSYKASSVTVVDNIDPYGPEMTVDGNPQTAWNTNGAETGDATGQWIELSAPGLQHVSSISILPGFCKDPDIWAKNRRPHEIEVSFSDGSSFTADLNDTFNQYQSLPLSAPVDTTFVRITIRSSYAPTYNGRVYDDCAISEIRID